MEEPKGSFNKQQRKIFLIIIGFTILMVLTILLWALFNNSKKITTTPAKPTVVLNKPKIALSPFANGFTLPTSIVTTSVKADSRLFISEQAGIIRIVNKNGQITNQNFLDIQQKVLNGGEMGLLGLVFSPSYSTNGFFYINYVNKNQETIIARYKVSPNPDIADLNSEKIILKIKQPYTNHNGGDLKFGADGYLYIALGDGGSGGDPQNRAQDKNSLFGKILRIDVNKGDPYSIPSTNPFVNKAENRSEIWAYGLRNPWRISFNKTSGDLYIADVGQDTTEEVDVQKANSKGGENYGWRCYEGDQPYNPNGCLPKSNYVMPVFEYNHQEGRCSITGGFVYRGNLYPAFKGKYFYGDFCSGQLYYAENTANKWQQTLITKTAYSISTFGQDTQNELYVADYNGGGIYKIIDTAN